MNNLKNQISNQFQCPACKNYIEIHNRNLRENAIIYCYNCNTYVNYKTNSYITPINKEVNRGSNKI